MFEPLDQAPFQATASRRGVLGRGSKGGCVAAISPEPWPERRARPLEQQTAGHVVAVDLSMAELPGRRSRGLSCGPGARRLGEVLVISICVAVLQVNIDQLGAMER